LFWRCGTLLIFFGGQLRKRPSFWTEFAQINRIPIALLWKTKTALKPDDFASESKESQNQGRGYDPQNRRKTVP
jgi:hypothetical protein